MSFIHVNSHVIRSNAKTGALEPPISVRASKNGKPVRCNEVLILGQDGQIAAKVVYSPDKPLSCGARLWIETYGVVELIKAGEGQT